jgi:hypothetical protein
VPLLYRQATDQQNSALAATTSWGPRKVATLGLAAQHDPQGRWPCKEAPKPAGAPGQGRRGRFAGELHGLAWTRASAHRWATCPLRTTLPAPPARRSTPPAAPAAPPPRPAAPHRRRSSLPGPVAPFCAPPGTSPTPAASRTCTLLSAVFLSDVHPLAHCGALSCAVFHVSNPLLLCAAGCLVVAALCGFLQCALREYFWPTCMLAKNEVCRPTNPFLYATVTPKFSVVLLFLPLYAMCICFVA